MNKKTDAVLAEILAWSLREKAWGDEQMVRGNALIDMINDPEHFTPDQVKFQVIEYGMWSALRLVQMCPMIQVKLDKGKRK